MMKIINIIFFWPLLLLATPAAPIDVAPARKPEINKIPLEIPKTEPAVNIAPDSTESKPAISKTPDSTPGKKALKSKLAIFKTPDSKPNKAAASKPAIIKTLDSTPDKAPVPKPVKTKTPDSTPDKAPVSKPVNTKIPDSLPAKTTAKPVNTKTAVINLNSLADALQKHYNATKSATFSFIQNYSDPIFPARDESGEVSYKEQKMKWDYKAPRKRAFYMNKNKLVIHFIEDNIAYTHDCFEQDTLSAAITFLWGKGNIKESFNLGVINDNKLNSELRWLSLTPKKKQSTVKIIYLGIDKKTPLVMESVVIEPNDGRNHFKFSNFAANPKLPDSLFDFNPPKNTKMEKFPNVECKNTAAQSPKP